MNTAELRALQAAILANPDCAEFVHTNDMPKISGAEAALKDTAIASIMSAGRVRIEPTHITERGVRALPGVLPRSRFALLDTLRSAATTEPAWLEPTLEAVQVPNEDRPALADDLASAWRWLTQSDGIDVGSPAARSMLDVIAAAVTAAAPACAAVKALAEQPDPITADQVSNALRGPWGDE